MVKLGNPITQARFNACIYNLILMRFDGLVEVEGSWDALECMRYLKERFHTDEISMINDFHFRLHDKDVYFESDCVMIVTSE